MTDGKGQTHQREERRLSVPRWRVSFREALAAVAVKAVRQDSQVIDKTHVWQVLSQRPSRLALPPFQVTNSDGGTGGKCSM